jgi:cytoskeletal protein CcmA (bactofilin family)
MFLRKSKKNDTTPRKKEALPSLIASDLNLLGNIISDGAVDVNGTIDGNVRCDTLTVRGQGIINGEVIANNVFIYGKIKGLIRAKSVHLHSTCRIEGIVMHESITIEDGAFIDGKCKRTDKVQADDSSENEDEQPFADVKVLENIRLIR